MKESEQSLPDISTPAPEGFQISDQPVVRSTRKSSSSNGTAARDVDLLYTIARDPNSLFVYWDVHWTRLFNHAGLSPREVHLRVFLQDGSIEGTREVNPFLDHCYVEVSAAGTTYRCELGCFDGDEWRCLVRSGAAATPADRLADDFSAQFATLPLHLSFQRMLETYRSPENEPATLAEKVGKLQESARSLNGENGKHSADTKAVLEAALRADQMPEPTAKQLAQWQRLGEHFGGSSRGGASERGFGGSS
ncbi:MAG: DUF4912 domain-containing protein [Verrucomicrobiota bacterium]|nr:DUF4912 domain-containing protein [Verrucomicrobiota bacterium]